MNYWIFQSNPKHWPIKREIRLAFSDELRTLYKQVSYWPFPEDTYGRDLRDMAVNDIVFIWKSIGDYENPNSTEPRGVYATAVILSLPTHPEVYTRGEIDKAWAEDCNWYTQLRDVEQGHFDVVILYKKNLLGRPVWLPSPPAHLADLPVIRMPSRRLYRLSHVQGKALLDLIDKHWSP